MDDEKDTLKHTTTKNINSLFLRLYIMLEADLRNPDVEKAARMLLALLRKRGFSFANHDLDCPDCLACLYLTLQSAAESRNRH